MTTPANPPADLVTWLRAVLDAREREIRERHFQICGHDEVAPDDACSCDDHVSFELAEVDAKRRILDHCVDNIAEAAEYNDAAQETDARHVLRLLALPFAGRPGFREEWKP